ncbi:MAG: hypothetical protein RLZZ574_1011, partial [Cyanobacteriota bacterium]
GSYLEPVSDRHVVDVAQQILTGAAYLYRVHNLKLQGLDLGDRYSQYKPRKVFSS